MRIVYCSDAVFPSAAAHSVQIVGMCDAFAQAGNEVLLCGKEFCLDSSSLIAWYGANVQLPLCEVALRAAFISKRLYGLDVCIAFRSFRPQLVYSRCMHSALFAVLLGYPTVYEAHTPPRKDAWLSQKILQQLLRNENLKLVVTISENVRKDLLVVSESQSCPIVVLPSGGRSLEPQQSFADAYPPLAGKFPVAYAGNLYPGKGLELIVKLAKACPLIDFHIAGTRTAQFAQDPGLSNLHFHGQLPPARIPSFLSAARCLIAPFIAPVHDCSGRDIARWTSPLKIFDYMSAGRPIVASALPGVMEVLDEGSAIILQDNKLESWVEALQYIEKQQNAAKALAECARAKLRDHYQWSRRVEKIFDALAGTAP